MDRKLNALFLFIAVVVFITAANTTQQWNILLGVLLATLFSLAAFAFRGLSLDGMFSAIVIGTFVFGLGGWELAVVLLLFFLSSVVISDRSKRREENISQSVRRDGLQVWANGFWLVTFVVSATVFNAPIFLVGAIAVIATATADTWATELGSRAPDSTYLITTFKQVKPGTDGGVSIKGTTAALFASVMIAAVSVYVFSLDFSVFILIFGAAVLGCIIDSYLGALFQQNKRSVTLSIINIEIDFSNNLVNAISTGIGGLLAIISKLFLA
ncbi:DUF92 domain-containing protein [Fodinibius sp. AD559]|uniref:DUF92 domain-containing protein n=1 Tax=Fodinibius sp. AD559 TaxID=3424179 RepID=UPI004046DF9A